MKIIKECRTCHKKFEAIKETQMFCQRKCFKRDYYQRVKQRKNQEQSKKPQCTCSVCGASYVMPYDPTDGWERFNGFICPFCGIPRRVIIDYDEDPRMVVGNSFTVQFVVASAIVSSQ